MLWNCISARGTLVTSDLEQRERRFSKRLHFGVRELRTHTVKSTGEEQGARRWYY